MVDFKRYNLLLAVIFFSGLILLILGSQTTVNNDLEVEPRFGIIVEKILNYVGYLLMGIFFGGRFFASRFEKWVKQSLDHD